MLVVGDIFLEESELELYKDLYLSPQIKLFKKIYFNTLYVTNYGLEKSPLFACEYQSMQHQNTI